MEKPTRLPRPRLPRPRHLIADQSGSIVVEAAVALPLIIVMLLGAISYGTWFMAAHSLQQAANDAARAALVGLDEDERAEIVSESVEQGILSAGTLAISAVEIDTRQDDNFYVVELTYDARNHVFLANPLIPLPSSTIVRSAAIQLSSI